jgi:hypothetical protein
MPEASEQAGTASFSGEGGSSAKGGGSTGNGNANSRMEAESSVAWWKTKPTISLLSIGATLLAIVIGVWTTMAEVARKKQLAETAEAFSQQRVAAVKERLKRTREATPEERAATNSGKRTLPLLMRPSAIAMVELLRTAGLFMLFGPKGEGKTSIVELLEQQYPFVILVDLENGSVDKAVRAVAAAMGYSLTYTAEDLDAKAANVALPEIKAAQGIAEFENLLLVFEQACNELRAEGALGDHVPVLILE